jgi:hypothetical protein
MDFDALGISHPKDLPEGWQLEPDYVNTLAFAVGGALVRHDDHEVLQFIRVASELEVAGNDDWAKLLVQAALMRLTDRDVIATPRLAELLVGGAEYEQMLEKVMARAGEATLLQAATLTVAGQVAVAERAYDLASRVLESASSSWRYLGELHELGTTLLGQAAALSNADEVEAAELIIDEALSVFANVGNDSARAMLLLNKVQHALILDDLDSARERLGVAREAVSKLNDGYLSSSVLLSQAAIHLEEGAWSRAREIYLVVNKNAKSRGDYDQLVVARRNLAKLTSEHLSKNRGVRWWMKARDAASQAHDWRQEKDLEHELALALADVGRYQEAEEALGRSMSICRSYGDTGGAAEAQADLGAIILSSALAAHRNGNFEAASAQINRAEPIIDQARVALEEHGNFDWAETAVRNLRKIWVLTDSAQSGAARLKHSAEEYRDSESSYSGELLRNAALLALEGSEESSMQAVTDLLEASQRRLLELEQQAWSLAEDASWICDRLGLPGIALQVFDAALSLIDRENQHTAWGNIQNDAALAATEMEDSPEASRRLVQVEDLSRRTQNRVLLALALGNLGELTVRQDKNAEARAYFLEAAELSEDVGDDEGASNVWSSIANSWVDDGALDEAQTAAKRARELAESSGSGDAKARALSARASVQYARGEYEAAHDSWMTSAASAETRNPSEYFALALDALAQEANWQHFKQLLEKTVRDVQRSRNQLRFASKLHLAGGTWLRKGRPRAAGVVFGYMVLLALEGATSSKPDGGLSESNDHGKRALQVATIVATVTAHLQFEEIPQSVRLEAKREFERTINRGAGEYAEDVLQMMRDFTD